MGFSPNDPNAAKDRANMMLAVVFSLIILVAWHFLFEVPRLKAEKEQALRAARKDISAPATAPPGSIPTAAGAPSAEVKTREQILQSESAQRIPIKGPRVTGWLSTRAGRLDDLTLNDHYTTVEKKEHISIFSPLGTAEPKYVDSGWLGAAELKLPGDDTVWTLKPGSPSELKGGGAPVVLAWDNGQGLVFERSIALDENYLFTVRQTVHNNTGAEVRLRAYNAFARKGIPKDFTGFYTLHEGPIGFMNNKEYAPDYSDLASGRAEWLEIDQAKGWIGITEKYWMVALLPEADKTFKARAICKIGAGADDNCSGLNNPPGQHFQTDTRSMEIAVAPGASATDTTYVYAGVKNLGVMQAYQEKYKFDKLELGLDFGIYYIITKPFFYILHFLISKTGSVGLAILLMTVIVRIFVFPLASKSFRSMAKMKIIAPRLKELQEVYKDDKPKLQMEIYELYKKEDANPFSGCWPILVQIPIIFALYKVILISVDLRHAPFWGGWIKDLSAPDPTTLFNLFGLIPWQPPQFLMIGAWPVLFCITMILQKRITPPMTDPVQERLQTWFPYIATLMMAQFASGLIIYWTWSNVLSVLQQYYILRKYGGENTSLIHGHADRRKKKKPSTPPKP